MDWLLLSFVAFALLGVAFLVVMAGNRSRNDLHVAVGAAVGVVSQVLLAAAWRATDPSGPNWIVPTIGTVFFAYLSLRALWRRRKGQRNG